MHHTPWGSEQEFVYCYCRLEPSSNVTRGRWGPKRS
jgi:hypothetical protein